MKRFLHISATVLVAVMMLSCAKSELPQVESVLIGKWAYLEKPYLDTTVTYSYLDFELGKCYEYNSVTDHIFKDGIVWGCKKNDFTSSKSHTYSVTDGNLILDDKNLGHINITEDSLVVQRQVFLRIKGFREELYPGFDIKEIKLDKKTFISESPEQEGGVPLTLTLKANVTPESARILTVYWHSTNPKVASVDGKGNVKVLKFGLADIVATNSSGSVSDTCHICIAEKLSGADGRQNSNCYIINKPGTYCIFANHKGQSTEDISGEPVSASLLWQTYGTKDRPMELPIHNVKLLKISPSSEDPHRPYSNFVCFEIPGKIGAADELVNSNAVIAIRDNFSILWSWHIWMVNGYDPVKTAQKYRNDAGLFMDRNLGAFSTAKDSTSFGLLYQWGRKDPFPAPYSNNIEGSRETAEAIPWTFGEKWKPAPTGPQSGTIAYSILHPAEFICTGNPVRDWIDETQGGVLAEPSRWSKKKSIYDPCPYGWKVPSGTNLKTAWADALGREEEFGFIVDSNGADITNFSYTGDDVWYPYCTRISGFNGSYSIRKSRGYWWSANTSDFKDGYNFTAILHINGSRGLPAFPFDDEKEEIALSCGLSVRCVKGE